ncbi:hypothetical protein BS47DRAFT_236245 [Hydnum rufescens UP504]|uniref:RING-type domain-containing protein n=1 Tax=Hydnum rufescens UP504 TaxID=1448309 RepID=A0A9P6AM15_9AGAM|nr:hypothetical protein BS47DRAFT_236245 [Hydnum rufescens UP504]
MFDDPISPPTPPLSDYSRTGDDFDFSRYLPSPPSTSTATSRPNSSELPTLPPFPSSLSDFDVPAEWDDYRRAPDSHRTVSPPRLDNDTDRTYGESWRDQARAFLSSALARGALERHREERAAMRERQARRDARRRREAQARESYVIMAIAGFYPDHMLLAPNLFLGQFDHDDFWALAELLGQVKPPVATKDDIEHSGLPVVKTEKISEYAENGLIATNTIERCLVCLSDYEEQEDIRILSCKHAFHKDCVDKWMEVGRNNCPACRTKVQSS